MPGEQYDGTRRLRAGIAGKLDENPIDRPTLRARRSTGSQQELTPTALTRQSRAASSGVDTIKNPRRNDSIKTKKNQSAQPVTRRQSSRRINRSDPSVNLRAEQRFKQYVEQSNPLSEVYESIEEARQKIATDLKSPKGDDSFPYGLAIVITLVELSDPLTSATIILLIFTQVIVAIVFYFYIRARMGFSAKFVFKKFAQFLVAVATNFIPVFGALIPANLIMLLLTHNRHKKVVQGMVAAYAILGKSLPGSKTLR